MTVLTKEVEERVRPVFYEIVEERRLQDEKWGGAKHDDQNNIHDWVATIVKHIGKAIVWKGDPRENLIGFRRQMIRVAAVAVAAVEWVDRINARQEINRSGRRYQGM